MQARLLRSFPPASVVSAHENALSPRHATGDLLPRLGGAGLEAGYGDQLLFQCRRSHVRTSFASQHRMHGLEVGPGHVFIGVAGDVRRPAEQAAPLLTRLMRGGVGLQNLWEVVEL